MKKLSLTLLISINCLAMNRPTEEKIAEIKQEGWDIHRKFHLIDKALSNNNNIPAEEKCKIREAEAKLRKNLHKTTVHQEDMLALHHMTQKSMNQAEEQLKKADEKLAKLIKQTEKYLSQEHKKQLEYRPAKAKL